jgi:hypothetical protein
MSLSNLVTQGELNDLIDSLNALADNLQEHVSDSLSLAHSWNVLKSVYLDTGGNYHTDFGPSTAGSSFISGLYCTGVNNDGSLAAADSVDQHWVLTASASSLGQPPKAYVMSPLPVQPNYAPYAAVGGTPPSQYISPVANGNLKVTLGQYSYSLTFYIVGYNTASVNLTGYWTSDNTTQAIILNGVTTGFSCKNTVSFEKEPLVSGNAFQLTGANYPFYEGLGSPNTLQFVVNNIENGPTSLRVVLSATASIGGASTFSIFNTGVNDSGAILTAGSFDPHWTLGSALYPDPSKSKGATVVGAQPYWKGINNSQNSKWIGPAVGAGYLPLPVGVYAYTTQFDLAGFDPATARLTGSLVSDNATFQVLLNGKPTGVSNGAKTDTSKSVYQTPTSFSISSGFTSGINTLEFDVYNNGAETGIQIVISGQAAPAGSNPVSPTGDNLTPLVLRLTVGGNIIFVPCQHSGGMDGTPDVVIPVYAGVVSPQSANPADDLTVGSPTLTELVTTFASIIDSISTSSSNALLVHAGSPAETVHGNVTLEAVSTYSSGGSLVGRQVANIVLNGIQYQIVGDTNISGPLNS